MAFGGYKFRGYHLTKDGNDSDAVHLLKMHKTRLSAFVAANIATSGSWNFDPNKLTGDVAFDSTQNAIHSMIGGDTTVHGYASFFKYDNDGETGYYLIITTNCYSIGTATNGISFSSDQGTLEGQSSYAPFLCSCLHAISKDPFGSLPTSTASADLLPSSSTRLFPIGRNCFGNSNYLNFDNVNKGFFAENDFYAGYAIKGKDIISFATYDPVNIYPTIDVISLNAFSTFYDQQDEEGLLMSCVNCYTGNASSNYTECNFANSTAGVDKILQTLTKYGVCVGNDAYTTSLAFSPSISALYISSGATSIPFEGLNVVNASFNSGFGSTNLVKGITNPELLASNVSSDKLSVDDYIAFANGNLLLVCQYKISSSSYRAKYPIFVESKNDGSSSSLYLNNWYFNLFIGWDESNPDLSATSSWTDMSF